jgi:hypothetical protein
MADPQWHEGCLNGECGRQTLTEATHEMRKFTAIALLATITTLGACTKTGEGEYQVETPDVDVSTDTTTIRTPSVDVRTDTVSVPVPKVDIDPPKSN